MTIEVGFEEELKNELDKGSGLIASFKFIIDIKYLVLDSKAGVYLIQYPNGVCVG